MEIVIYEEYVEKQGGRWGCGSNPDFGGFDWLGYYLQIPAYRFGTNNFREDHQRKFRNLRALREKTLSGEVVAYLSLIFILMLSFCASVLESSSIQVAKNYRRADMNRAIECVFAEYQKELLEHYDIFALDASYETGNYEEENIFDRLDFYGVTDTDQELLRIQFLTDSGCDSFYDQVTKYMENKYGVDFVRDLLGTTSIWNQQQGQSRDYEQQESDQEEYLENLLEDQEEGLPEENNPISHVSGLKQMDLLALVVPSEQGVSEKGVSQANLLTDRARREGYGDFSDVASGSNTMSGLLFGEYLLEHFPAYTDGGTSENERETSGENQKVLESGTAPLDYQLEYILAGKSSDRENLKTVVNKLMLIRFVPNFTFIMTDSQMRAEAEAAATALCTLLMVPEIIAAVTQVILLAWAYGETVMDLRALLSGKHVATVKSRETWQLSLESLMRLGTQEDPGEGMDAETGMDYRDYLRMLLFLEQKETKSLRTLSVIEQNMRYAYGQSYFQADSCVSRMELESTSKLRREIRYSYKTYYGYN